MHHLAQGGYIERAEPIILIGDCGTGKTHLLTGLCVAGLPPEETRALRDCAVPRHLLDLWADRNRSGDHFFFIPYSGKCFASEYLTDMGDRECPNPCLLSLITASQGITGGTPTRLATHNQTPILTDHRTNEGILPMNVASAPAYCGKPVAATNSVSKVLVWAGDDSLEEAGEFHPPLVVPPTDLIERLNLVNALHKLRGEPRFILKYLADSYDEEAACSFATVPEIVDACGLSTSAVKRYIRFLEWKGLIRLENRDGDLPETRRTIILWERLAARSRYASTKWRRGYESRVRHRRNCRPLGMTAADSVVEADND
jgi:hypothetical protein